MERIAIIVGKLHSGGKKNLIMEYYRNIDRTKVQFDFICDIDSNAIPKEEIKQLGGRVFEIAPYQHILKNMRQMSCIFKENKYTVMHCYNGTMNLFPMFVGWCCRVPVRISESISMAHKDDKKTILKKLLKPFSKWFATNYMANGECCGRWQFGDKLFEQGKVKVFKTVINTEQNKFDLNLRVNTRRKLGIDNKIVIGHIGRLTEQKNTLFIIDIFNEILKMEPSAVLLIIGDGNLKKPMIERIQKYHISNNVLYLGRREDIQQFYNAMDCFLLPSLYEGLPVVGVEAETCGLPVFFSKEIPKESNACEDLGFFLDLSLSAREWASIIIKETKQNMKIRTNRVIEVKKANFDSQIEAKHLLDYYSILIEKSKLKNEKRER